MPNLHALAEFFRLFKQPVVLLDLETTGGNTSQDRITEIAFLHFQDGRITPVSQLVNPQTRISPFIENLTGISNDMVADAPLFAEILQKIMPLLRGSLIIAHNSRFDYPFLRHECRRAGVHFAASALCSVQLSRKLYPEHHKHSLDAIIERHGIATENRHRAMSDVLALAQFLQTALHERGTGAWQQYARQLASPVMQPENLSESLRQTLNNMPDSHGVSLWYDHAGNITGLHVHEQAYRETVSLLHKHRPDRLEFTPAFGALHAQTQRIILMQQHNLLPPQRSHHTIQFQTDPVSGSLKARVRPLESGWHTNPPNGLFLHPKAAKRTLSEWARRHQICPTLLGILPNQLPQGEPCPVSLIGECSTACTQQNTECHNRSVQAALSALPVCDWWHIPRLTIRETDPVSGGYVEFLCDSGTIMLPENGLWYTDAELLAVFKQKHKQHKNATIDSTGQACVHT